MISAEKLTECILSVQILAEQGEKKKSFYSYLLQ